MRLGNATDVVALRAACFHFGLHGSRRKRLAGRAGGLCGADGREESDGKSESER